MGMRPAENTRCWRKNGRRNDRENEHDFSDVLRGIEERWLEREAGTAELEEEYRTGARGGLSLDLELVALTTPNVHIILLSDPDDFPPA